MKTIDLAEQAVTVDELLTWATQDVLRILTTNGHSYILEETDAAFEQEVEQLGQSEPFLAFLATRAQELGGMSLDEFAQLVDESADLQE